MSNNWFQFKQFRIEQQRSALKVGTDGVLLGAWCRLPGEYRTEKGVRNLENGEGITEEGNSATETVERREIARILDIGTGTGLIALMLAQRTEAKIDAVEISDAACNDARNNFQKSPWANKLKLYQSDCNHFFETQTDRYDLVVCNPPFFEQSFRSADINAALARHNVSLTFYQLISGSRKMLNDNGLLAVIIPAIAFDDFRETARLCGFYLSRKTQVIPKIGKTAKRVLLEFSVVPVYPGNDELVILQENNEYAEQFVALTRDFYLNFL